jgi:ribosomal protein S12 methylthiotransferase accessory factor
VAAISADRRGRHIALGFATRISQSSAAEAAVCELMQMELKAMYALAHPDDASDMATWLDEVRLDGSLQFIAEAQAPKAVSQVPELTTVDMCIDRLVRANCRVAVIDRTREEFEVPVVRAISPDLCHWKPRFGRTRLLQSDARDLGRHPRCRERPNPTLLRI